MPLVTGGFVRLNILSNFILDLCPFVVVSVVLYVSARLGALVVRIRAKTLTEKFLGAVPNVPGLSLYFVAFSIVAGAGLNADRIRPVSAVLRDHSATSVTVILMLACLVLLMLGFLGVREVLDIEWTRLEIILGDHPWGSNYPFEEKIGKVFAPWKRLGVYLLGMLSVFFPLVVFFSG